MMHQGGSEVAPGRAPEARRLVSKRRLHGELVLDDYAWMRDPTDPGLLAYLAAERGYYETQSDRLASLTDRIRAELEARLPEGPECSAPWEVGDFVYRMRLLPDGENPQLLRSSRGGGEERVVLDGDVLARDTGYAELGVHEPSPDGALLAWSVDRTGAEVYELRIRDLAICEDLPEVIGSTYIGVAWSADSEQLFYLVADPQNRPFQVWRHRLGGEVEGDVLVYEERDRRFELTLTGSRSGSLALITSASRDTTEVHVLPLADPLADPILVASRRPGIEYRVDHLRSVTPDAPRDEAPCDNALTGQLLTVTNESEPEFSLATVTLPLRAVEGFSRVECDAIAPARADTRLLGCDVLAGHLVLTMRRDGAAMLAIVDHGGRTLREVPSSLQAGTIRIEHAEEYDSSSVIIAEESLIEPTMFSRLSLDTGERTLLQRLEVPGYDPSRYRTERRTAPGRDGVQIPVTLAYHADTPLDGSAPCLLYGYGAYEATIEPAFKRGLPSLLDRGVVYVIAHIRGGGERGRDWWRQGMLQNKPTTFTDFIDVADWLAGEQGLALIDGARIASRGASAGGLLQGAVFSMRPDRWRAVVAEVPFVDCVNSMLDDSLPLTVNEWDEWGDPRDPGDYACMRRYCPYENPPRGRRPALLVTGAVNDVRVGVHEPAKWVARLRATDENGAPLLFRPELGVASHGGPSGRRAQLGYEAEVLAFILDAFGIGE
jgi:oligopeptidase B